VFHELTPESLMDLKDELMKMKEDREDDEENEYTLVIFDDWANAMKDKAILRELNQMLIKARHLNCSFIFTVQSYLYFPKILRKQLTWASIFNGVRNKEELQTITKEIIKMKEDDMKELYEYVFDAPYNHMDIDLFEDKFYKNGNPLAIQEKK
jgi:hypothetical protein